MMLILVRNFGDFKYILYWFEQFKERVVENEIIMTFVFVLNRYIYRDQLLDLNKNREVSTVWPLKKSF